MSLSSIIRQGRSTRPPGRKSTSQERTTWTDTKLIQQLKMSTTFSFGGSGETQLHVKLLAKLTGALVELGATDLLQQLGNTPEPDLQHLAKAIIVVIGSYRDGIAHRQAEMLAEIEQRLKTRTQANQTNTSLPGTSTTAEETVVP
jgi:hypothetical protein